MADEPGGLRRHFTLDGVTETEAYQYAGGGGTTVQDLPREIVRSKVPRCEANFTRWLLA